MTKKKQQGIVLLMLVIMLVLIASSYYFSSISVVDIKLDRMQQTQESLRQARQALIDYARTHADGNGGGLPAEYAYLPCPDKTAASTEGNQDPNCGARHISQLGYLPWRSLDMPALKDGSGSCLWYAVSGSYKGENSSGLVNYDTVGQFQLFNNNGALVGSDVVAIVIAPGHALAAQNRNFDPDTHCGADYGNEGQYLEGNGVIDNSTISNLADAVDTFIYAALTTDTQAPPYNDFLAAITRDEIWQALLQRSDLQQLFNESTEALALCLANYVNAHANKRFPWPAPMDVSDYRDMDNYSDVLDAVQGYAGRFPFHLDDSNAELGNTLDDRLLDNAICSNLNLTLSGAANVDLNDMNLAHRKLLENWKDHFFYAVSKDYALPDDPGAGCGGGKKCVKVDAPKYAAIVFFANIPYPDNNAQPRTNADKAFISNYLENNNDAIFPDADGDGNYTSVNPAISNDLIFCLKKTSMGSDLVVTTC